LTIAGAVTMLIVTALTGFLYVDSVLCRFKRWRGKPNPGFRFEVSDIKHY